MNKKELKEYQEKYGNVPKDFYERFTYVMDILKLPFKDVEKIQNGIRKLLKSRWEDINLVFYLFPKATPRARNSGRSRVFYVKGAADHSKLFKEFIDSTDNDFGIITTPCKMYVDLYIPISNQMSKIEKILAELRLIRPVCKPDWDNAGKTYSDMIQKHLLLDDSLCVEAMVRKYYSFKPRIELRLSYMTKYDCKFNKKKIEGWKTYEELEDKIVVRDSII